MVISDERLGSISKTTQVYTRLSKKKTQVYTKGKRKRVIVEEPQIYVKS